MKLQRKELRKVNWKVFYYLLRLLVLYFYTTIYTYDYYLMLILLFKFFHADTPSYVSALIVPRTSI